VQEGPRQRRTHFWRSMRTGLSFVSRHRLLVTMAVTVGAFQMCYQGALVVQILIATRLLQLSEHAIGLCYVAQGMGTIFASSVGHALARRIGPGPTLVLGIALCAVGWLLLALAPAGTLGVIAFTLMLSCFGVGAVFLFINFLALRQAVTPAPLLGRMTTTMRWLILLPGPPGALLGGWLGEHLGLQAAMGFSGGVGLLLALLAMRQPILRNLRTLPSAERDASALAAPPALSG